MIFFRLRVLLLPFVSVEKNHTVLMTKIVLKGKIVSIALQFLKRPGARALNRKNTVTKVGPRYNVIGYNDNDIERNQSLRGWVGLLCHAKFH